MNNLRLSGALLRARTHPLFRSLVRTAGTNGVIALLGALGGLLLARGLGAASRGELSLIIAWPAVLGGMAALGMPQATTYASIRRPNQIGKIVGTALAISATSGGVLAAVGYLIAPLITNSPDALTGLRIVFLMSPFYLVPGVWTGALQALDNQRWNRARLIQPLIYFPTILVLVLVDGLTLTSAVAVYVGSIVFQLLTVAALSRKKIPGLSMPDRSTARWLLGYGVRAVAERAPWIVNARLDQMVLSVTVPAAALGNYAAAVSLTLVASPLASAFGHVGFPAVANSTTRSERLRIQRVSILGCFLSATLVLAPIAAVSPLLIPTLFGPDFNDAVTPFIILAPSTVLFVTNRVMGDLLKGLGRPGVSAIAEWMASVTTLVFLLLLVPTFGIIGAAVTSMIAYSTTTLFMLWGLRRANESSHLREDVDMKAAVT